MLRLGANVRIDVYEARTGRLLIRQHAHNLISTVGRNLVRDLLNPAAGQTNVILPDRIALGTGSATPASNDTALGTEVWRDVFSARVSGATSVIYRYFLTSGFANGNTLREAGLFNQETSQLFARVVHSPIGKTTSVTILYVWTVSIGAI